MKELNVLVDDEANVKICDFGLACQFKNNEETNNAGCGTPGYWSPEQVKREPYRMMPDWFSLGVMMYKLMMRQSPFEPMEPEW